jgi:serine/threonine-protein kinase
MQGRVLSDLPGDALLRAEWDSIASEVLGVLEDNLTTLAREQMGSYSADVQEQWRRQVNQKYVSSTALYDLADAKFASLYPQSINDNFVDQPIGQIWYGLAYDRVEGILSNTLSEEIRFEKGEFSQSLRHQLQPGEGKIYTLNLSEGQLLRLNLQVSPKDVQMSLYVPSPNEEVPYLLQDSHELTWSGQLPQSGYYEIVIVSTQKVPTSYAIDVSIDNISIAPASLNAALIAKN